MHPSFKPDSTTLLLLINALRTVKHAGKEAKAVVEQFRRRYGAHVVDDRVRWRLAWLALKERNVSVAQGAIREHDKAKRCGKQPDVSQEFRRPAFHEILPAQLFDEYWEVLRYRLQQLQRKKAKAG